ncbi:hypothetical protein ACTXPP_12780 [Candidatus Corynebacterium faecigallinarum]|uniref:hypothetical protein n=1 Tax=Candidatus Corynebacterium faecigallinarum TaxID=2838528 RepID=UPI003FD1CF81
MPSRHGSITTERLERITSTADGLLDALLELIEETPAGDEALLNKARVFKESVYEVHDWAYAEAYPPNSE